MRNSVIDEFQKLYYPVHRALWRGVPIVKCAQDLIIYQEIIHETQPEIIVECGVNCGGSTLFLAEMSRGTVVACDIDLSHCHESVRSNEHIRLLEGNSTSAEIVAAITELTRGKRTMVVLDSAHGEAHVLQECRSYGPLVSPGCYMIVEDSCVNGNPLVPEHGPGPAEAIALFLQETKDFKTDLSRERFLLTFNPGGYLLRLFP
jgi:cephalosporin hydroxylase